MINDPIAQELWNLCKSFPNMGIPDQIRFVNAYAIVRLAKAVEGLSALSEIPQALRDAAAAPTNVTLGTVSLADFNLNIPNPVSAYTANVAAKKIPNL